MRYPERLLTDDEVVLREFHPHWRVLIPAGLWTVVVLAALVLANRREPLGLDGTLQLVANLAILGVWLATAGAGLVRWWFTQYVLTTERIVVRLGMIARTGTEIPLESVNNVLFSQSVIERLLGFGDVLVESAGSQGQSRLRDIPDPEGFQSQVYRAREARSLHLGGGHGPHRDTVAQLEALADLHDRGALTDEEFAVHKRRLLQEG